MGNYNQYERKGIFTPDEVLPFVVPTELTKELRKAGLRPSHPEWKLICDKEYNGKLVRMTSSRYRMFKMKGLTCVSCGFEGTYFALEKHKAANYDKFHFNCYGIDENGNERMITKDHIIPRSIGGPNHIGNYQPMCDVCNSKKENDYYTTDPLSIMADADRLLSEYKDNSNTAISKARQRYRIACFLCRTDFM